MNLRFSASRLKSSGFRANRSGILGYGKKIRVTKGASTIRIGLAQGILHKIPCNCNGTGDDVNECRGPMPHGLGLGSARVSEYEEEPRSLISKVLVRLDGRAAALRIELTVELNRAQPSVSQSCRKDSGSSSPQKPRTGTIKKLIPAM